MTCFQYRDIPGCNRPACAHPSLEATCQQLQTARAEIEKLRAEISDARALVYNSTVPRTVEDQKGDLCEQIALLVERNKAETQNLRNQYKSMRAVVETLETCQYPMTYFDIVRTRNALKALDEVEVADRGTTR